MKLLLMLVVLTMGSAAAIKTVDMFNEASAGLQYALQANR